MSGRRSRRVGRRASYTDRLRQRPVPRAVDRRSWPPRWAAAIVLSGVELILAVLLAAFWRAAPRLT